MGSTSSPETLVQLDRSRPRSLRSQLEAALRDAIRAGRLAPGTRLPSSRALAADLGITRGVVVDAYDQLRAEGYIATRPGSGTVVSSQAAAGREPPTPPTSRAPAPGSHGAPRPAADTGEDRAGARGAGRYDFRPGMPDLGLVPRRAWQRAWRDGFGRLPDGDLGYGDPRGLPALRRALADYLGRVRGVIADPEQVVVTNGFSHGLSLVAEALQRAGIDGIALEDPGQPGLDHVVRGSAMANVACPVDGDGLDVDALAATGVRAVLLTPAHQFPTGVVLGAARRSALAEWARAVDGYVVEDDYDAEYRYDRSPVGAVQGVLPERGIYAGTLSKSLAPGFRLGWLVVPPQLLDTIVGRRGTTDLATNAPMQAALALFLERGDLDRHLRRTRRIYARRRDALVAAAARLLPEAELDGVAAGLHVVLRLPPGTDERALTAAAAGRGVTVYPMADYRRSPGTYPAPALVLGYGNLTPDALTAGVHELAAAYRNLDRNRP
jgi:GntR family transcriptional regulator / MocR family aminotransferase